MKKHVVFLAMLILSILMSGCTYSNYSKPVTSKPATTKEVKTTENVQAFYDKVVESKVILDEVATDVCAAWKDASSDYKATTKDINNAIEKAKKAHSEDIDKIKELDTEIQALFKKAKEEAPNLTVEFAIKNAMTRYSDYKDSILNANEALDSFGYVSISSAEDILESSLHDLFAEL